MAAPPLGGGSPDASHSSASAHDAPARASRVQLPLSQAWKLSRGTKQRECADRARGLLNTSKVGGGGAAGARARGRALSPRPALHVRAAPPLAPPTRPCAASRRRVQSLRVPASFSSRSLHSALSCVSVLLFRVASVSTVGAAPPAAAAPALAGHVRTRAHMMHPRHLVSATARRTRADAHPALVRPPRGRRLPSERAY